MSRERLTAAFEHEWVKLAHAAREDIIETYGSAKVVAQAYEYDETQLSRVLDGKANPPGWLIGLVVWRCKGRHFVTAAADLACADVVPRPEPTRDQENAAVVQALRERGMYQVARGWAGLPEENL